MPKVLRIAKERKVEDVADVDVALTEWDAKAMLLQAAIPLGFKAACALLEDEVIALTGPRSARHNGAPHRVRWGRQRGSIYLTPPRGEGNRPPPAAARATLSGRTRPARGAA